MEWRPLLSVEGHLGDFWFLNLPRIGVLAGSFVHDNIVVAIVFIRETYQLLTSYLPHVVDLLHHFNPRHIVGERQYHLVCACVVTLPLLDRIFSEVINDGFQQPIVKRSEEHTSELQSRENLVCRLLLEKKK